MNDQVIQQAEEALEAVTDAKVPEEVTTALVDNLTKMHEFYTKFAGAARDAGTAYEGVYTKAQNGAKVLTEKLLDNSEKNAAAVFETAKAAFRCKDATEIASLNAEFFQAQLSSVSAQAQDFVDLATRLGNETVEAANTAATKTFEKFKAVA